jgi:serine protease DegQ
MKRQALYSRATRKRSAGASLWMSGAAAVPPDPRLALLIEERPSAIAAGWAHIKRFCHRHERPLLMVGSALIALAAVGLYSLAHPRPHALTQNDIDGAVQYTLTHMPEPPADTTRAAALVAPSVVEVEGFLTPQHAAALVAKAGKAHHGDTEGESSPKQGPHGPGHDGKAAPALPDRPLVTGSPDEPQPDAIGSGVVITDSGKILTALHVVSSTDRWVVVFADGSKSDAELVGAQPENDLAVLQPRHLPDELPAAPLASTANLRPGDTVVATGFPFGIGPSVSAGVVSGLKREFDDPDHTPSKLTNLIQFDAPVNPGNSGGPLVNRDGEVVGIVTAIVNPSGARVWAGIGFAVPIENAARAVGENPL